MGWVTGRFEHRGAQVRKLDLPYSSRTPARGSTGALLCLPEALCAQAAPGDPWGWVAWLLRDACDT